MAEAPDPNRPPADAPVASLEPGLEWWFDDPCEASADNACLPPFAGERRTPTLWASPSVDGGDCTESDPCDFGRALDRASTGDVIRALAGDYPRDEFRLRTDGVTIEGPDQCCAFVPALRVDAADTRLAGMRFDTVVITPSGDDSVVLASRLGSLFVNGADGVQVLGNRLRPHEPGQDVMQVKSIDGDGVDGLLIEGNVLGPQDSDGGTHTDCVQLLDGDGVMVKGNVVFACGDKAFQLRSGVGGTVRAVTLEGNVIYECGERRDGCNGFHAIIWASTELSTLTLRHNTIFGSVVSSTSGSTIDPGANFVAIGNLAGSLICTVGNVENQQVNKEPCNDTEIQAPFPDFIDDSPLVGDARLVDPTTGPPRASAAFGPGIDGTGPCATPRIGAAIDC